MKFILLIFLLQSNLIFADVEQIQPVIPPPEKVYWHKIRSSPYPMVIKTKKHGDFNLTQEAEKGINEYKKLCEKTGFSFEIPAIAIVNNKNEVTEVISPPERNILPIKIDMEKIYECNEENPVLIEELKNPFLTPDRRDYIIQKIIANAVYHPMGKFYIIENNNKRFIAAEVLNQKIFLPAECIGIPLANLLKNKTGSLEGTQLRKDWYVITSPNMCFWTDYFKSYIEIKSGKEEIKLKIPIHLHTWTDMQWLLNTEAGDLLTDYKIYILPSKNDIEFFKATYSDADIYIIAARDLFSEELEWAVYDDIDNLEKRMQFLESAARGDTDRLKITLHEIRENSGVIQRYYRKKGRGLVVDEEIDSLLILNKRQMFLSKRIDSYKKKYPWRLFNESFLVQVLNQSLKRLGETIVPDKRIFLGYNRKKKEFYYKEGVTPRMELFLYVIFNLSYSKAEAMDGAVYKEKYAIKLFEDLCPQLDYLCIKYYHFREFSEHLEYLADVIRQTIWEKEKVFIIAKEQINNGRQYLNTYNLGYFNAAPDTIRLFSEIKYPDDIKKIDAEEIIRKLSKKHSIRNVEEFIIEFEKRFVTEITAQLLHK